MATVYELLPSHLLFVLSSAASITARGKREEDECIDAGLSAANKLPALLHITIHFVGGIWASELEPRSGLCSHHLRLCSTVILICLHWWGAESYGDFIIRTMERRTDTVLMEETSRVQLDTFFQAKSPGERGRLQSTGYSRAGTG